MRNAVWQAFRGSPFSSTACNLPTTACTSARTINVGNPDERALEALSWLSPKPPGRSCTWPKRSSRRWRRFRIGCLVRRRGDAEFARQADDLLPGGIVQHDAFALTPLLCHGLGLTR